jgi:hypothetical protein
MAEAPASWQLVVLLSTKLAGAAADLKAGDAELTYETDPVVYALREENVSAHNPAAINTAGTASVATTSRR